MTYPWVDSGCIGRSGLGIPSNYGKDLSCLRLEASGFRMGLDHIKVSGFL